VVVRGSELDDELKSPHERIIEAMAHICGQNADALVLLHPLQQVCHFNVNVAVVGVAHIRPLPKQGIGLIKKQNRVAALCRTKDALELFSVSSMYLLTIWDRLTRNRSKRSSRAITCAAIVLPVPPAPVKRTFRPLPGEILRLQPQAS